MSNVSHAALSDRQLVEQLAKGDVKSLGELYVRYDARVKTALCRFGPEITNSEREALLQNVFLSVHDSAGRFPDEVEFAAWIYGICVKKVRAWQRKTWIRRRLFKQLPEEPLGLALHTNSSQKKRREIRMTIASVVERLPKKQREALLLQGEGFSSRESAQILGISYQQYGNSLHRARRRLSNSIDLYALQDLLREEKP